MNSRDFGVPQNRLRVFMVSILNCEKWYHFPKPFPLEKRLKDVLEDNVDEKYYLKDEQVQRIVEHCDRKIAEGCGFKTNFIDVPPKIDFNIPLALKMDYIYGSGMDVPKYSIVISRECTIRELMTEIQKQVKMNEREIVFPTVAFPNINYALESDLIVCKNYLPVHLFIPMRVSDPWIFDGFKVVNPNGGGRAEQ